MLQGKNLFFARFLSSQIRDNRRVFYAQMTSFAVRYDAIWRHYPFSIFEYVGVDSPDSQTSTNGHFILSRRTVHTLTLI